jgi:hypothetical protein
MIPLHIPHRAREQEMEAAGAHFGVDMGESGVARQGERMGHGQRGGMYAGEMHGLIIILSSCCSGGLRMYLDSESNCYRVFFSHASSCTCVRPSLEHFMCWG